MNKLQAFLFVTLLSLLLVSLSQSAAISEAASSRNKRQTADVRVFEYLAEKALEGRESTQGCEQVACGVVDVFASSRNKRQTADVRVFEYLAEKALEGRKSTQGCEQVACGVVDVFARVRRSSADQRIAELQALLALSRGKGSSDLVAHGMFDPDIIGKKKRDGQFLTISDDDRYNILKALIRRAAQENTLQ